VTHYPLRIWRYVLRISQFACLTVSTGEAGPTLCPAPINYPATCFRRHPFAKSMVPGPFDPAGLKSALHIISSLFYLIFYMCHLGVNCHIIRPGSSKTEIYDINHKVEIMSRSNILPNI
jgi:hypothetical protein